MQRILIVGLGNLPLPKTRHSVGHYILDSLAFRCGFPLAESDRLDGFFAEGETSLDGQTAHLSLFKPKPLMNIVGRSVAKAVRETVKTPRSLIVIQDSLNHEPGKLKVKFGGSPEGNRGIRSVSKALNHDPEYFRLQVGIGRGGEASTYVLGPLSAFEKQHWSSSGKGIDEVWGHIEQIARRMDGLKKSP